MSVISKLLPMLVSFSFLYSPQVLAEIYSWVDSAGRSQFSDWPNEDYSSSGYVQSHKTLPLTYSHNSKSPKELEDIAKQLKSNRLKREKAKARDDKARLKKNKKRKQQLAAAKKRKLACKKARNKEDLAFRSRTQRQGLSQMRKALANYEKKQQIRREKCQ